MNRKKELILAHLILKFNFGLEVAKVLMEEHSDIIEINADLISEEIAGQINEAYEQGR